MAPSNLVRSVHTEPHGPLAGESLAQKIGRRAVTFIGLFVLFAVDLALLPVLLLGALAVDLVRRRPLVAVRFQLAVAFALVMHVIGLSSVFAVWLVHGLLGRAREQELDFRFERWWATALWSAAMRLFGMRVVVEGEDALEGGPIILMSRHASLLDTLLPVVIASGRHGFRLRYVAKQELIWDPFFDLLGHRLPSAFVRRDGRNHAQEIALVDALALNLTARDGVAIFPEGTRFTAEKRAKILASLEGRDPAAYAHAARLKHLLPPHVGGPLGLVDHAFGVDVVFCGHTGLEGANHLRDLLSGSLVGGTVRVRYWRALAEEIPADPDARLEWLRAWWERLDAWIDANADGRAPTSAPPSAAERER